MHVGIERIEKPPSLKDEAYRQIKALILSDALVAGKSLDIDWLAAELGISRTPIREALLMLQQEGLVETIPYRGTFVAELSRKDVEEIYQVRQALESLAVKLATPVIPDEEIQEMQALFASVRDEIEAGDLARYFESDTKFHELVVRHCGNTVLQQALGTLIDRIYRVRVFSKNRPGHHMKHSFQEHCGILDALAGRDVAEAERLMAEHVDNAGRRIAELVEAES